VRVSQHRGIPAMCPYSCHAMAWKGAFCAVGRTRAHRHGGMTSPASKTAASQGRSPVRRKPRGVQPLREPQAASTPLPRSAGLPHCWSSHCNRRCGRPPQEGACSPRQPSPRHGLLPCVGTLRSAQHQDRRGMSVRTERQDGSEAEASSDHQSLSRRCTREPPSRQDVADVPASPRRSRASGQGTVWILLCTPESGPETLRNSGRCSGTTRKQSTDMRCG
jgi:hypothetical protein